MEMILQQLIITRPDDWHVHFRDGVVLNDTVKATSSQFARALVMPNLKPALTSLTSLLSYYERIQAAIPKDQTFQPFMTFFLNENLKAQDLIASKHYPFILGAKLYPSGVTTHSQEGTADIKKLYPLLDCMQEQELVLQIHGECTEGDIFERESLFLTEELQPILKNFPRLRIVLEHISTKRAVDFVKESSPLLAATITAHHLLYNRNQLLAGNIRPHYYCLPILKRASDQKALQEAAVSANPKFFAGTDSAPHARHQKETAHGCAGVYSAPFAIPYYAEIFDRLEELEKLNSFLSVFGAQFYQQNINLSELLLEKKSQRIPETLPLGTEEVVPLAAGESLRWSCSYGS